MRAHAAVLTVAIAFASIPGSNGAYGQGDCGDLDGDTVVDALDATVLREHLAGVQALELEQSLLCDVVNELRAPGLEPDPADLAGTCSIADAAVMARNELGLPPGPAGVCALASGEDCCAARVGVGCNFAETVTCTCVQDASCCTVDWDGTCASLACETACAPNCPAGQAYCSGQCAGIEDDAANCGDCGVVCGTPPDTLPNTLTYVCSAGACAVGACEAGFLDCNASPGCETTSPASTSCSSATHLGTVWDWDGSGPVEVSASGQIIAPGVSRWYKVHAADPPFDDWKLLVKVFNVSAGIDADLFAYRRASGNTCTSSPAVTPAAPGSCNANISGCGSGQENSNRCSSTGGNASECVAWFESCTGTLEDDETEVWIEVRHVSGGCGTFDLKVRNNGNNDPFTCASY